MVAQRNRIKDEWSSNHACLSLLSYFSSQLAHRSDEEAELTIATEGDCINPQGTEWWLVAKTEKAGYAPGPRYTGEPLELY